MRRKYIPLVVLMALAVTAGTGAAQVRPFVIGISGGPSFPVGDLKDEASTGYHVQASVGVAPAGLPAGIRADLLWQEFSDDIEGYFRGIGGLVNAVVAPSMGVVQPYVLGGVGVMRVEEPETDHGDHTHGGSETPFTFAVGGGVAFPFMGLSGVLEARFLAAGSEHRGIPVSIGIRF